MESLIGFVLPPVIELVNQKISNPTVKFLVSLVISAAVAVAIKFNELKFASAEEIFSSVALIAVEAQIAYRIYWHKDSPIRQAINK